MFPASPLRPSSAPGLPSQSRTPRWGHVSRSVSRYGVVSCVLVIYPPDSSERERRLAEAHRLYAPLSLGGGVVAWVALCAQNANPLFAAAMLVALLAPIGCILNVRSRDVRRRAVVMAASRSGLTEATAAEQAQQLRLDTLAETLEDAAFACRRGFSDRAAFERVWRASYDHALALVRGTSPAA